MKYCYSCGKQTEDDELMCNKCGSLTFRNEPVPEIYTSKEAALEADNNQAKDIFNAALWGDTEQLERAFSSCLVMVFLRMFTALLVTAITAYAVVIFDPLRDFVYSSKIVFWGLLIGEFALVIYISRSMGNMSAAKGNALFFLYAAINGLTLSSIFLVYNIGDIYSAFGISALMFVVMAVYGALTRRDLSSIGSICMMGLFGIIVASIFNFFINSSWLHYVICYIGVLVFVGLTAFDTQNIKLMLKAAEAEKQEEAIRKIAVTGALILYLDFICLFLEILGRKK